MMGDSLIGDCDCCDRKDVPRGHFNVDGAGGVETFACYVCQGDVPDPYCELEAVAGSAVEITASGIAALAEYEQANGLRSEGVR